MNAPFISKYRCEERHIRRACTEQQTWWVEEGLGTGVVVTAGPPPQRHPTKSRSGCTEVTKTNQVGFLYPTFYIYKPRCSIITDASGKRAGGASAWVLA